MDRRVSHLLDQWMLAPDRKPLVLRGARQVGKTWLVRDLARRQNRKLVELNMERRPELADHFLTNDPRRALSDLSADLGISISIKDTLLFIDEIQAAPQLLAFLRWFREDLPDLPVIAAGSLLDLSLEEHTFSMPVGRISYCYVEPLSFYEFLDATDNSGLRSKLAASAESMELSPRLHQRSLELFAEYCLVGGLPEVVASWVDTHDDDRRLQLQRDLIATYRDDFNKYRGSVPPDLLRRVMDSIPRQLGGRFMFSHVEIDARQRDIKRCHELLCLARICHRVEHTAANGLPLGAETKAGLFKTIVLDVGLASIQLGLSRLSMHDLGDIIWANKGGLAEQFVGQQLRCISPAFEDSRLFYWQRTEGRQGEIDFIIQEGNRIIPIEVKAGSSGSMKSLHSFMLQKKLDLALRLDTNPPSIQDLVIKTTTGEPVAYTLISLPLYMVESIPTSLRMQTRAAMPESRLPQSS